MSYLDQLNASPKFEVIRPEKPKHPYFLKLTSSFLPIMILALGLGAALFLIRNRQKVTTKASLETTNLFMVSDGYDVSIFAASSSGKLVAIELPINYPSDLLEYQGFATSSGFPNLLPGSFVIVAAPPDTPMIPAGLVGTLKFRSTGVGGVAHITFGAVRIAGLNSLGEPLSENLSGSLTGVDITIAGPTATPTLTPTPTTPITITNTPTPTLPTTTIGASPTPTPTPTTPVATATLGASPTPTERPYNNCGGTCGSNMNCKGDFYCYIPDPQNHPFDGVCRNPMCYQSADCICRPTATPSPKPTATIGASPTAKPTAKPTLKPTIRPTATAIPTPFVIRIPSSAIGVSPTLSPISTLFPISPTPVPTSTQLSWWEKFVEWLRKLFGK